MNAKAHSCQIYRRHFQETLKEIAGDRLTEEKAIQLSKEKCHPEVLLSCGMPLHRHGAEKLAHKVAYQLGLYGSMRQS